jgi:hypothetical protein
MNAAYVEFPFDVEDLFGKKGQVKIKAMIDNKVLYRGSLANMGYDCHVLGITQEVRKQINKTFGDIIDIKLEQDLEERVVSIPDDVQTQLNKSKKASEFFESLSFTHRKEYMRWVESAKKEETRKKRIVEFVDKMKAGKKN